MLIERFKLSLDPLCKLLIVDKYVLYGVLEVTKQRNKGVLGQLRIMNLYYVIEFLISDVAVMIFVTFFDDSPHNFA